nr:isochorismatase family protein [Treponema phagedenis]
MKNYKLKRENALILFVDIQDKLLDIMQEKEEVLKKAVVLAKMANIMQLETLFTEQYPKGLGHTNKGLFDSVKSTAIEKTSFSCMLEKNFTEALTKKKKNKLLSQVSKRIFVCF